MSPVAWLKAGLGALRWNASHWGEDCPGGTPVPAAGRCAGLDCDSVRLLALAEGERGRVTCLEDPGSRAGAKLAALGVLPGIELILVQRSPAFVFRIGYAELAVDEELAGMIRVRR